MTKLYTADDEGGILFKMGHNAWGVSVPAYVYDIWQPLLGVTAIGVYTTYTRLGYERQVFGQGLRELAAAMRIGPNRLQNANEVLAECGFIAIDVPQGHQRKMHYTTKITVLEAPRVVPANILKKYVINGEPERYRTLVPWLVDEEASNHYPAITQKSNHQVVITASGAQSPDSDAKNESLKDNDSSQRVLQRGETAPQRPVDDPYGLNSIAGLREDKESRQGEQTTVETPKGDKPLPGQEQYTKFETWLLAQLSRKNSLNEREREKFHQKTWFVPKGATEAIESPTVNEAWENAAYRTFVAEHILPEIKSKNLVNITGFNSWLNSAKTWKRFYAWNEYHGEDFEFDEDEDEEYSPRTNPDDFVMPPRPNY